MVADDREHLKFSNASYGAPEISILGYCLNIYSAIGKQQLPRTLIWDDEDINGVVETC